MNALPAIAPLSGIARLEDFVEAFAELVASSTVEAQILALGYRLLRDLVRHDDWLPDAYAAPAKERYQQYLLHLDPLRRFSVVSFVWGTGQATPVHDHRVWGLVGMLRGAELVERFRKDEEGAIRPAGPVRVLERGAVDAVSPRIGDIHRVANAFDDRVSISIHVYGADIGSVNRATYDRSGVAKSFISGYADLPPLIPGARA